MPKELSKKLNEDLIYEILSVVEEIPEGRVASYGQVAQLIGREKTPDWSVASCPWLNITATIPVTESSTTPVVPPQAGANSVFF